MTVKHLRDFYRKDPEGFYILLISEEELSKVCEVEGLRVEKAGPKFVVKTKSRACLDKLLRKLGKLP
ncbi:MAG: hypothetical protein DRJ31_01470 [Candidatus Methanomethylicota archaeon]|uniref:Uncharacterized protein n=1 Tax=Thermoproteota archaeon TaxID=2056631 RepID=A0A497EU21_9CREN|nr:MAG: hypothetical protein DRJ31_01470 [Candidatus Verstraetearchaeota archaeon]